MTEQAKAAKPKTASKLIEAGAQVVGTGAGQIDPLQALNNVVEAGREYLTLRENQKTKREEIDAYRVLESERIRAAERVLSEYFRQVFAERAQNFDELWRRLDEAAEQGQDARVSETLLAIVSLAQKS
ncbi:MAG: hypothetical protein KY456_15745, partial [Chloroflexi bacterium]|nr:hypothetical protein [Chloroflexota bacterium]